MATRPSGGLPVLSRRAKRVLIAVVAIIVAIIIWFQFVNVYVNYAWYREVDVTEVFTTQLWTRVVLFLVAGGGMFGVMFAALFLAFRSRPVFLPSAEIDPLAPYRTVVTAHPKVFALGISILIGVICGFSAQGSWQTVQLWMHGGTFGIRDPQFGNDIGFYMFRLPMIQMVLSWLFIATVLAFVAVLVTQYVFGGIRLSAGKHRKVTAQAALQLSLVVGLFVLVKAVQYWFDRYDLLFSSGVTVANGQVAGAGYTDVNAVVPAKIVLMVIAAICAVGFIVGGALRSIKLPVIALALLVLCSVLIGGAWPLILQKVVVAPNAITKEQTYIQRDMDSTRQAYGITGKKVTYVDYNPKNLDQGDPAKLATDSVNVPNARLLDPNVVSDTFTQRQQLRTFYGFEPILAMDRYTIDGQTQDYVVAARELNLDGLQASQQGWINEHLIYTHGDGFVAAPANQLADGYPIFTVSDLQNQGLIKVTQPRIYYSPMISTYSIVGGPSEGPKREYDSENAAGETNYYTYTGSGGVPVGNFFERLIFATHYADANFLFSSEINSDSKVMYIRDPRERVEKAAPFLTADTHPYPAVVGGRIVWIVDAYTTANDYPYSAKVTLSNATSNSLQAAQGTVGQAATEISYIRNSVKAVVDAYTGKVTLYQVDGSDPVLKAWESVFPGLVDTGPIPRDLSAHFRYPEDLFEVQRQLLSTYYVSDPTDFYQGSSFWQVPTDPTEPTVNAAQPPYYLQIALPGQSNASFQLTSALTWLHRDFASAYVTVESDPHDYGRFTVLKLRSTTQTPGPLLIQQAFNSNTDISNYVSTRTSSGSAKPVYGNLLTLPTANGLLYVEPLYLRGNSTSSYPQLGQVLVWYGQRIGMGPTLVAALQDAAKHAPQSPPTEGSGGNGPSSSAPASSQSSSSSASTPPSTQSQAVTSPPQSGTSPSSSTTSSAARPDARQALQAMQQAEQELALAKSSGDLAKIGAATENLYTAVQQYLAVAGPGAAASSAVTSALTSASGGG